MTPGRIIIGILSIAGLIAVFLFQQIDVAALIGVDVKISRFLINRTIRFLLNDALALGLIYALFQERKYVIFALYVQVAGIFLFLVPYFILKNILSQVQRASYFFSSSPYSESYFVDAAHPGVLLSASNREAERVESLSWVPGECGCGCGCVHRRDAKTQEFR